MDGGGSANHTNCRELRHFVGEGHEVGDGTEGLVGEGGVEAGEDDSLTEVDELEGQVFDSAVEELSLVEAYDVDVVNAVVGEELSFEAFGGGRNDCGIMGLRAVAGDGGAVVAEVDVGLEAGDTLAGDTGALEAANELFGFA